MRSAAFIESYGLDGFERSCRLLAEGGELPAFYVDWSTVAYGKLADRSVRNSDLLVVEYTHPIIVKGAADSLARTRFEREVEWLAEFGFGSAEGVSFDMVDWYFLPLNDWSGVERTGPVI